MTNACFKQEKKRWYTWKAPGDTWHYQLDILRQERNSAKNSYAYPGADADRGHKLVMITVYLALKNVKCRNTRKPWDTEKLSSCVAKFSQEHINLTDRLNKWNMEKAETIVTSRKDNQLHDGHNSKQTVDNRDIAENRRKSKIRYQSTEQAKNEYRGLNKGNRKSQRMVVNEAMWRTRRNTKTRNAGKV